MTMTRPTTEQITHNGQILKDVLGPVYNVMSFGAVGDGVTDDFDALIAAVNAVKAAGGGTVYIPVTANGYYLRYGTFCSLSAASNIAIVSDGATLKLQGGTTSQTQQYAVFATGYTSANNITIRGLRFVSASTVTRYLNGGSFGTTNYDPEVVAGRANPNEQSSFRWAIALDGAVNNITVDDCYFGPGIYNGVTVRQQNALPRIRNVTLSNLTFDGVNSMCMLVGGIDGLTVTNIKSDNHDGCKFDWTLYVNGDLDNAVISNVIVRNPSINPLVQAGVITIATGNTNNIDMSNVVVENGQTNPLHLGNTTNGTFSSMVFDSCPDVSLALRQVLNNVLFSDIVIRNTGVAVQMDSGNVVFSNFMIENAASGFVNGSYELDWTICNGVMIDCGAQTVPGGNAIRLATGVAASRRVKVSNVDFVYRTYVPSTGGSVALVDVRGASAFASLDNCNFRSLFGTATVPPVFATSGGTIEISNCTSFGFSGGLTYSSVSGEGVVSRVEQLPNREQTVTANSATPSVLGNKLFVTANTSATAYTNFTDGVQGQEICIRVNDANTTFDFTGTNLKGRNGVDYTATSGDVIFAKRIGSNWYCTVVEA